MSDIATQAVIAFCVLLVIWYIVGWQMNRRRGRRLLEWTIQGLRAFDGQITVSRLGTSGFQVDVRKAHAPFKRMEATIFLEPREILLLWLSNLLRGGGADYLVFKGTLRASPQGEVEVVKKKGRLARRVLEGLEGRAWTRQETADGLARQTRPAASGGHFSSGGRSQPPPAETIAQQESPAPSGESFPSWSG
jgi:hypothetical protein